MNAQSLPDTVCFSSQAGFSQSLKDIDLSAYLGVIYILIMLIGLVYCLSLLMC